MNGSILYVMGFDDFLTNWAINNRMGDRVKVGQ